MKTRLQIEATFDPKKTDAEALATALDRVLKTGLSIPGITDEYGKVNVGEFTIPGKTTVVIEGGNIQDIYGPKGSDVEVIDFDNPSRSTWTLTGDTCPQDTLDEIEQKVQQDEDAEAGVRTLTCGHKAGRRHGCEHEAGENCLICSCCGECREDLDESDLCIDCGGQNGTSCLEDANDFTVFDATGPRHQVRREIMWLVLEQGRCSHCHQ